MTNLSYFQVFVSLSQNVLVFLHFSVCVFLFRKGGIFYSVYIIYTLYLIRIIIVLLYLVDCTKFTKITSLTRQRENRHPLRGISIYILLCIYIYISKIAHPTGEQVRADTWVTASAAFVCFRLFLFTDAILNEPDCWVCLLV